MTTTAEPPVAVARPYSSTAQPEVAATGPGIAATGPGIAATGPGIAATMEPVSEEQSRERHRRLMIPLSVLAVVSGLAAAAVGFALSYGALREAAVRWGFGASWQSHVFPIGVDGLIIALYTVDLVMAWRRMSRPWMRIAAHAVTGVTIALNMAAAAGSAPGSPGLLDALGSHPARLLSHAAMPIAYALLIEAARGAVVRVARLESGSWDEDRLTLADWALRPITTWKVFKHAKTWPSTVTEARTHVRDLAVYRIWLAHREELEDGLEAGQVGVLDRMPQLLARYGVSVDEARALPDVMRERERRRAEDNARADRRRQDEEAARQRDEERRREQQARQDVQELQRQAREDEHAERLAALAAEKEETRLAGELAVLRAEATGAARSAEAIAAGAGAAAELEAQTTLAAARRAATEEERRTAQEEAAEESERTAAAKRRVAEHNHAVAAAERKAAEEAARIASARAAEKRSKANEEEEKLRAERAIVQTAEQRRMAAETNSLAAAMELATAEKTQLAAETRARAAHAEALADLTPVQIKTRTAARVLLANPQADGAAIATALGGASASTASTYRKAAQELISLGYPETDPDLTHQ